MIRTALVLGGGVGGLSTAVALRRAGIDVTVVERAPELRAAGFGLSIQSNAMSALRTLGLGLDEELLRMGGRVTTFTFRAPGGALLRRLEMGSTDAAVGAPSVVLARKDLHAVLLAAAGSDLRVELGADAVGFDYHDDGVLLRLADGRELAADVLIGADGINSMVRAELHGAAAPRSGGFVCWLALAPFRHPAFALGESVHYWGQGMRFGVHDIGGDNTYWWGTMTADPDLAANWPYGKHDLARRFHAWAPEIGETIAATDTEILALPAQDRPPLSWWGRGRVTLLGDAAHPMLPSLGQGANSAIEDGVVLAHALAQHDDPATALRAYEQRRIPRTTELVDGSQALGRFEQATNRALCAARNRYVRYVPEQQLLGTMTKAMIWPGFGDRRQSAPAPRPLSPLERWHWTADQAAPLHICSSVRIAGPVDVAALRAALEVLPRRHPILRAAITSDAGSKPRFVPAELRPIPLRLTEGAWQSELDRELRDRFDPDVPLVRATLITVAPDTYDFVLTSTYSIADGVTVVALARQVLELATGGAAEWAPEVATPAGPERLVPKRFRGVQGKGRGLVRMASDAVRDKMRAPTRLSPDLVLAAEERFTRVAHRMVDGVEFRELLAESRRRHLRFESVVGAALAMAAALDVGAGAAEAKLTIGVSVPFRDQLETPMGTDTVGSFQALLSVPADLRPGRTLWQAAGDFDARLRKGVRHGHHLAALNNLGLLTPKTPEGADGVVKLLDAQGPGNLCMTLLDVADFPSRAGAWELSGMQVVSGISISGYSMLTVTVGSDELALNLGYVDGIISPRRAEALIENTTAALRKASSDAAAAADLLAGEP